jgi:hypothetical protein
VSALAENAAALGRRLSPTPLLLAAMVVAAAYIVALGSKLSFLLDDWGYIVYRRGFDVDVFMRPDNEHFVAGPVAVWKLLIGLFGIDSMLPFKLVSTALFLAGAWLLFVWMRRRVGGWAALLATLPLLFLGAAFDDVLWFASITFLGAMACGLGMLVALDRRDRRGDVIACALLVGSLMFSSLWLAFLAGAIVDVVLRRDERPWRRRAFLIAVPIAVYAIWWLGWGHTAETALSLHNLATTPLYVLDSIAAGIAALLGLAIPVEGMTSPNGLDWGRPLAVVLIVLAAWRLYRAERVPRSLWVVLAIALSFWILGGLDVKSGRVPSASRYQYPSAAFVLLIAAGLLSGVRLERRLLWPALVVIGAAILSNSVFLHEAYLSYLRTSQLERADLTAVEIARDTVEPGFRLEEDIADTGYVGIEAGAYLGASDAYGSPAYSPAELAVAPETARVPADKVLAAALGAGLSDLPGRPAGPCASHATSAAEPAVVSLPPGGVALRSSSPQELSLGRFSESFPVQLGTVEPGRWQQLRVPTDRSSRPWLLRLSGEGKVTLCGLGDGGA